MNEQQYNKQKLTEYLLGASPAAETEHFDELSFTDEEFAAALDDAEKDLVDGYVQNELSGKTLEKFNSHYLVTPLRREKVEFARAFQIYAEQNFTEKNATLAAQKSQSKGVFSEIFSELNIFKNRNLIQWSFAALAIAVVLTGVWWIANKQSSQPELAGQAPPVQSEPDLPTMIEKNISENTNAQREIAIKELNLVNKNTSQIETKPSPKQTPVAEPKQPLGVTKSPPQIRIASFVLTPSLRSGSRISSLSLARDITDVAMSLQLEADDYDAYRVKLLTESNATLWQSGSLKLSNKGENKSLNVRFPAKSLKSEIYFLQVSGISADGASEIISDYPFRIVRQ